jgi:hypothetical protein
MSLHLDTLFWFRGTHYLLFLLYAVTNTIVVVFAFTWTGFEPTLLRGEEKKSYSLVRTHNLPHSEASTLTNSPQMGPNLYWKIFLSHKYVWPRAKIETTTIMVISSDCMDWCEYIQSINIFILITIYIGTEKH